MFQYLPYRGTGSWGIMKINSTYIIIVLLVLLSGCIERYYLDDKVDFQQKLVVDCTITDACHEQEIVLSYTSTTDHPYFIPCSGAIVYLLNKQEKRFDFIESIENPGHYIKNIENEFLLVGDEFTLFIETENGKSYQSTPQEMLPCPPVDSIYYSLDSTQTADANVNIPGIQFYVDFNATDYFGRYYRWVVEETYEYHSTWPKEYYIEGWARRVRGPLDYSTFTCYKTEAVSEVFTLTTDRLLQNTYIKSPLHFVNNKTQRLMYNYSVNLKQRSVSKEAFVYWNSIQQNNQEVSGLFSKQPSNAVGNVFNVNDESEIVLGFFGVSSETEKRLIIHDLPNFSFENVSYCHSIKIEFTLPTSPRPLYLVQETVQETGETYWAYAKTECFDCTLLGGVVEKPDFFIE